MMGLKLLPRFLQARLDAIALRLAPAVERVSMRFPQAHRILAGL